MEMMQPSVSIIIPVYNGSDYLAEAIESALGQTYINKEIIVIDDGSDDNGRTQEVIARYQHRIRAYRKTNGGVASALNFGIRMMGGTYMSWLSHDDKYLPDKISHQMAYLQQQGQTDAIVYSGCQLINGYGQIIGEFDPKTEVEDIDHKEPLMPVMRLLVNGCTLLIHKKWFAQVGMFDESLPTTQDYDMWYRLFRNRRVYYSPYKDVQSRSHEAQGSRQHLQAHIKECDTLWIKMIMGLTEDEMIRLDGSPYQFLAHTYQLLKGKTLYAGAIRYLEKRMQSIEGSTTKKVGILDEGIQPIERLQVIRHKPKQKIRIAYYKMQMQGVGGLEKMTGQMIQNLSAYYEVFVAIGSEHIPGNYVEKEGIHYIGMNPCVTFPMLADLFVDLRIDVFIGCHNYLDYVLAFYEMLQGRGVQCIAWNHEDYFFAEQERDYLGITQERKQIYPTLARIIWINQRSKRAYETEACNGRYIPNIVEQRSIGGGCATKEPYAFISVGRFEDSIKQLDKLLEVFAYIYRAIPHAVLYVIGNANLGTPIKALGYQCVGERVQELGIPTEAIHFTGWVSDVGYYYDKVKIQLNTSKSEGFGLVIPEAGSHGVPTIAFRNGGVEDIIQEGINGYLIEPGDTQAMAERARQLIQDEGLYIRMAREAKHIQYDFNRYGIVEAWKSLIQEVCEMKGGK